MNPLKQLEACGQSPWLDYLKRSLIENGELRTLIERDGLKGVTSNPSIFEKAIGESDEYADALKQFQAQARPQHLGNLRAPGDRRYPRRRRRAAPGLRADAGPGRLYQPGMLALSGQRYRSHRGRSAAAVGGGRAPQSDGEGAGDPGRHSGDPPADRRGLNINITLLFSVSVYEQVVEAYISGLEDLARAGGDVAKIGSVASFFVSRIDTRSTSGWTTLGDQPAGGPVARQGGDRQRQARLRPLQGAVLRPALAALWRASGAKTQRLLWASTGTKNPAYKDTMYVEALIGRDTVNTIPPATMDAFRDHGEVTPDAIEQDIAGARAVLAELEQPASR